MASVTCGRYELSDFMVDVKTSGLCKQVALVFRNLMLQSWSPLQTLFMLFGFEKKLKIDVFYHVSLEDKKIRSTLKI